MQVPYDPKASLSEQVAQSFQTSLKNLQTTYLDCLVLHSPLANQQHTLEVWQAMEQIFHSGGAKQLGISNCYDPQQFELLYRDADGQTGGYPESFLCRDPVRPRHPRFLPGTSDNLSKLLDADRQSHCFGACHAANSGGEIPAQRRPNIFPLLEPNRHYSVNRHHIGKPYARRPGDFRF